MTPALSRSQVRRKPQGQNDAGLMMVPMMLGDTLDFQVDDHDGR
jgi:hypothetical protein